jgi:starch-binding outer membrane protein, SusD/RagB family
MKQKKKYYSHITSTISGKWISIGYLFFFFVLPGCKKYLEKKSNNNVGTIERIADLQAIIDNWQVVNNLTTPSYSEASTDDYFFTDQEFFYNNGGGEKGQAAYTWQYFIQTYENVNDWAKAYVPVNLANICLESIEKFPKTPSNSQEWNNVKGSAHFIRAFNFLNLVSTYAKAYDPVSSGSDPGIPLRLNNDINEPTVRATVQQSYSQIIDDAMQAAVYLPEIAKHPLRPSKAAAFGLLARAYLVMRDFENAGIYADKCLNIRKELIDYNGDPDIVNPINGTNSPFRKYNKETIYYAEMNSSLLYFVLLNGSVDTALFNSFENDDLRKTAFFTSKTNGYQKFKGNYTQSANIYFGGITTSEIFLIRAESLARKGRLTEAMDDLNTVKKMRWNNAVVYKAITADTIPTALRIILEERRRELVFRGLRWIDIKRLNKEGFNITPKRYIDGKVYILSPNSDRYALPIPQDIIELTGIAQNAGWQ